MCKKVSGRLISADPSIGLLIRKFFGMVSVIHHSLTSRCYSTPPPVIDAELDQLPWIAPPGKLAVDSQPGMISSAFVETVKLMAIGDKILNTL